MVDDRGQGVLGGRSVLGLTSWHGAKVGGYWPSVCVCFSRDSTLSFCFSRDSRDTQGCAESTLVSGAVALLSPAGADSFSPLLNSKRDGEYW